MIILYIMPLFIYFRKLRINLTEMIQVFCGGKMCDLLLADDLQYNYLGLDFFLFPPTNHHLSIKFLLYFAFIVWVVKKSHHI